MGEVYRARDPRLNRIIAIKILPHASAMDAERRDRFTREAQAIAKLNHPSIVTVHSIEEIDGQSLITMELVEGRTLAETIPASGMPLDQILQVAIPIADAVAAAHQKGITHRDLKPANIVLGEGEQRGRVKVLDFGLARLAEALPEAALASAMPTTPITGEGRIVGTAAYMSPEQAEGKPVDSRSDLFSLGVILYEMATGERPFTGDTSISIIASIVKDTPKSITDLKPGLPKELGRIVRRALVKDPERRYQSAKEMRNDLEELKAALDSGELAAATASDASTPSPPRRRWPILLAATAILVAATAAVMLFTGRRPALTTSDDQVAATPAPAERVESLTNNGSARNPALSRDGRFVAYVQETDVGDTIRIFERASKSDTEIVNAIPGASILAVVFKPDGSFVDYVARMPGSGTPSLFRVPILGHRNPERKVDKIWSPPGWSPDGTQMAYLQVDYDRTKASLVVADSQGSPSRVLFTNEPPMYFPPMGSDAADGNALGPVWLPDGKEIAVAEAGGPFQIVAIDVSTRARREVARYPGTRHSGFTLATDEQAFIALFARNRVETKMQLSRIPLSGAENTRLTTDASDYAGVSVAKDLLVTAQQIIKSGLWIAGRNGENPRQIKPDVPGVIGPSGLAWSGNRVIHYANAPQGQGLWSTDAASGDAIFLMSMSGCHVPVTSFDERELLARCPAGGGGGRGRGGRRGGGRRAEGQVLPPADDGRAGTYESREGGQQIHRANASDGTDMPLPNAVAGRPADVAADGSLWFEADNTRSRQSIWILDAGSKIPRLFWDHVAINAELSPDGKSVLLLTRDEQDDAALAVIMPRNGGEPTGRVRLGGVVDQAHWFPDGRAIAFVKQGDTSNIWTKTLDEASPKQLTTFDRSREIVAFAWSKDGKQLAISRVARTSDIIMRTGIK